MNPPSGNLGEKTLEKKLGRNEKFMSLWVSLFDLWKVYVYVGRVIFFQTIIKIKKNGIFMFSWILRVFSALDSYKQ